jgi:hypothetical protein
VKEEMLALRQRLAQAEALLREALDGVDADEEAREESWPEEVKEGSLVLDLGDRIRAFLRRTQRAESGPQRPAKGGEDG